MDIYTQEGKKKIIKDFTPKTRVFRNSALAFVSGGFLSALAEGLRRLFLYFGTDAEVALTLVSVSFIALASILTAIGVFDKIARYTLAGTLVPITGFSNGVTSEAIDAKSEGFVLGVGSKIFTVAGPVILFGISSGVIYGIIYFIYLYIIR